MKKFTKILSVFMAIVMVATCIPMTVFAEGRKTDSLSDYLSNENLAIVVEDLLTALDDRKDEIVPTALSVCFGLIDALKAQADEDGIDVADAETEELADSLNEYGVMIRSGLHCAPLAHKTIGTSETGTVRFSLGIFNTLSDIEYTDDVLKKVLYNNSCRK